MLQGSGSGGYLKFDEGLNVFNLIKFVKKKKKMEWISTQLEETRIQALKGWWR